MKDDIGAICNNGPILAVVMTFDDYSTVRRLDWITIIIWGSDTRILIQPAYILRPLSAHQRNAMRNVAYFFFYMNAYFGPSS